MNGDREIAVTVTVPNIYWTARWYGNQLTKNTNDKIDATVLRTDPSR